MFDAELKRDYDKTSHENEEKSPKTVTDASAKLSDKVQVGELPKDVQQRVDISIEEKITIVNQKISDINESLALESDEKAEKIANELNAIGFKMVDATKVLGFTDQKIEVVQMDVCQELYRRGYDTEGRGQYGYGSWWSEERLSIEDTRNKLAVCELGRSVE